MPIVEFSLRGQLSDTASVLYTCPASTTAYIKTIIFFNKEAGAEIVEAYVVDNVAGAVGTADLTNQYKRSSIPSGDNLEWSPSQPTVLSAENDTIQGKTTTANGVNYIISVREVT